MCTYNISIADSLAQQARETFGNNEDMSMWMQQQIEHLLIQYVMKEKSRKQRKADSVNHKHALSEFRGILESKESFSKVREDYISEKYGI